MNWTGDDNAIPYNNEMLNFVFLLFSIAFLCFHGRGLYIFFFNKMRQWLHYSSLSSAALQEELAWLNSNFSFEGNFYQQIWDKNSVRCCSDFLPPVPFAITTHLSNLDCSNLLFPFVFQEVRDCFFDMPVIYKGEWKIKPNMYFCSQLTVLPRQTYLHSLLADFL